MPQSVNTITAPLGANQAYDTGWQQTGPQEPWIDVLISSDQSGTLLITEKEQGNAGVFTLMQTTIVAGAAPRLVRVLTHAPLWRMQYLNGSVAQAVFSLSYWANQGSPDPSQTRLLWLILKELKMQSMLLANLKEPSQVQVNLPFGMDPVTPA